MSDPLDGQLSVVLVTYNSADCIGGALQAVHEHLPGAETIVVDNGSSDGTLAAVAAESPRTKVVRGHGNVGFGGGCNRGAAAAATPHVLFLNPDVRVVAADVAALAELTGRASLGLVAPLLSADGVAAPRHQVFRERGWIAETIDHVAGSLWPRGWSRGRPFAAAGEPGWASGAALLVRGDELERLGGFDERIFLYYEDRDLSRRYRQAGLAVTTTDALVGRHAGGASSAADSLEAFRLACAVLGWIEYLAKWDGERRARGAVRLTVVTLALVRAAASLLALRGSERLVRKRRQLAALHDLLVGDALELPADRYPAARRLLA